MGRYLVDFQTGGAAFARGKASRVLVTALCAPLLTSSLKAQSEIPVAVELVLALDSSASMDRAEFELQTAGLAAAFRDDEVIEAINALKPLGAAVAVIQWGGQGETQIVVPFVPIASTRASRAFGFRISRSRRAFYAATTSIATAITDGTTLLNNNQYDGLRRVIDVSGDGEDNSGLDLEAARRRAQSGSIIVNGLAIEADGKGLAQYYEDNVIVGVDAFVEKAQGFEDYARAIKEKLLRELRPLGS